MLEMPLTINFVDDNACTKIILEEKRSSITALVINALNEPKRDRKKTKNIKHNDNISLDDVVEVTCVMRPRSMAKDLGGTVKEILDTCISVGCTIDSKDPKDLQTEIVEVEVDVPLD